jgi:hypothetical protein
MNVQEAGGRNRKAAQMCSGVTGDFGQARAQERQSFRMSGHAKRKATCFLNVRVGQVVYRVENLEA